MSTPSGSSPEEPRCAVGPAASDRKRDFNLLWSGSATSQLGTISAATAGPLLALGLTGSPVFAGWVTAASTVPSLLLQVPAGLIVDRCNRRLVMLASQTIRLFMSLTLVAGLAFLDDNIASRVLLLTAAATDGIGAVFYRIAETTALRHVIRTDSGSEGMAKAEARNHIALMLGRPLGGALFSLNRTVPYLFDALTCLISIITLRSMSAKDFQPTLRTPEDGGRGQAERPAGGIGEGIRHLAKDPILRTVLVVCTITNFLFQTIVLLLVVSAQTMGFSSSLIGVLLASSGLGGLLGALAAPRVVARLGPRLVVITCVVSWLPLAAIIAATHHPGVGLVAWGSLSFMGAHLNVALAMHQMTVPEELLGRVAGINGFFTSGAVSLGACCAGYLINALSTHGAAEFAAWAIGVIAVLTPISLFTGSSESPRHADDPSGAPAASAALSAAEQPFRGPSIRTITKLVVAIFGTANVGRLLRTQLFRTTTNRKMVGELKGAELVGNSDQR